MTARIIEEDQPRNWVAGAFEVATHAGKDREPIIVPIAGWVKYPFALDFRVFDDGNEWIDGGWYLTHIPTGFGIGGIIASLSVAKTVADEILKVADWSFTDAGCAKVVAPAFREFSNRCPTKIVRRPLVGPTIGMASEAAA